MCTKIDKIEVAHYRIPLEGNLVDALHGKHDAFELITATVYENDGVCGTGYTYTGGFGGEAITAMLRTDLVPQLIGREVKSPEEMNHFMNQCIHYVARGGIASFAISALNIAFWDAKLKREGKALKDVFGTPTDKVRTYYGGIDLMLTCDELLRNIEKQAAQGHTAFKIKIGKPDEDEDVQRVKAVRNLIGEDALLMVDANMVWDEEQSIRMARRLEKYNIYWLEEPSNPDHYSRYARIGQATTIPIAMGENLHTLYEHKMALEIGRINHIIPDCSNVCGITGFFRVAQLADSYHLPVHSHGMQELHANVLGALKNRGMVEFHSFPIYQYTTKPLPVQNGYLPVSTDAGIGVEFDFERIKKYIQN